MLTDSFFTISKKLFDGNEILYISCPINTGERFINWYTSRGKDINENSSEYYQERKKYVIEPNIVNAKEYIKNFRKTTQKVIIDPTNLESEVLQWSQDEFYKFWDKIIKDLVDELVLLDGWEYSIGCCHEYLFAIEKDIKVYTQNMELLSITEARRKISVSIKKYESINLEYGTCMNNILDKLIKHEDNSAEKVMKQCDKLLMKDEKLNYLISNNLANIAQFISFEPNMGLTSKFVHINNFKRESHHTTKELIEQLILSAPSNSVNIRSFSPEAMKGNRLIFDKSINDIDDIINTIRENSLSGMFSIVNENININDAGVSGVALGDVIEFSPEDTPKCVDKEGVCSLPRKIALKLLKTIYGFSPELDFDPSFRIEFSIHPSRQGVNKKHTIIWEYEYYENINNDRRIFWPNRFSKFIGDKVFGLLIADAFGLPVPKTTVISRKIAPFSFGLETGLKEKWIRTCPVKKEPGKYYTGSRWIDPFELMNLEESKGEEDINLASLISQNAVESIYSGASFVKNEKINDLIEGVAGKGDKFMVGEKNIEELPFEVIEAVGDLNDQLRIYHSDLGDVSFEWVYDGKKVWVVQLNQLRLDGKTSTSGQRIIVDGNPSYYEKVFVKDGLDNLRKKIDLIKGLNVGIELIGNIGITSHFGDVLRLANVPSKLTSEN